MTAVKADQDQQSAKSRAQNIAVNELIGRSDPQTAVIC